MRSVAHAATSTRRDYVAVAAPRPRRRADPGETARQEGRRRRGGSPRRPEVAPSQNVRRSAIRARRSRAESHMPNGCPLSARVVTPAPRHPVGTWSSLVRRGSNQSSSAATDPLCGKGPRYQTPLERRTAASRRSPVDRTPGFDVAVETHCSTRCALIACFPPIGVGPPVRPVRRARTRSRCSSSCACRWKLSSSPCGTGSSRSCSGASMPCRTAPTSCSAVAARGHCGSIASRSGTARSSTPPATRRSSCSNRSTCSSCRRRGWRRTASTRLPSAGDARSRPPSRSRPTSTATARRCACRSWSSAQAPTFRPR